MRSFVSSLTILLFLAVATFAQVQPCSKRMAEILPAQELRGFALGMTIDQLRSRVPSVHVAPPDEFGVVKTTINPEFARDVDKAMFQGVRSVSFDFLDGKLISLAIGYNGTFQYQTVEEFLPAIAKSLGLPNSWESKSWRGQEISCSEFKVTVRSIAQSPSIELIDGTGHRVLDKRMADAVDLTTLNETTSSTYKVGQVWSYKTRPTEKESTFTVLKIESNPKLGIIVHIGLGGLKMKNPRSPDVFSDTVQHMPFAEDAINRSAVKLLRENSELPDFEDGYAMWRAGFEARRAGVYSITIAEAVVVMETSLGRMP